MTTMTSPYPRRTQCPVCDQWVCVSRSEGKLRHHGPKANPCPTSGRRLDEVFRRTVTADEMAYLRTLWRIGDVAPIERWLDVTCPPYLPAAEDAGCADRELAALVQHARQWITQTLRESGIVS